MTRLALVVVVALAVAVLGVMVVDDFDQVPGVMSLLCGTWLMVPASTISVPS